MKESDLLTFREFHWKYFSLHADQRLKTFNFFIVVSAIFIGAYMNMLDGAEENVLLIIFPIIIALISFVFWKLDIRTKHMIKNAEKAIKSIDSKLLEEYGDEYAYMNLFQHDDNIQAERKDYSYSKCFSFIFILIILLGISAATYYTIKFVDLPGWLIVVCK